MVMSLLESLYKSLYKNVKDPALSIFRSPHTMAAREKLRLCGRRSRPHCGLLASQTQIPPFLSLENTPRRVLFGSGKIKFPSKSLRRPYISRFAAGFVVE